jgi:hypothetical protein
LVEKNQILSKRDGKKFLNIKKYFIFLSFYYNYFKGVDNFIDCQNL